MLGPLALPFPYVAAWQKSNNNQVGNQVRLLLHEKVRSLCSNEKKVALFERAR
jgi:hypothetical protein